MKRFVSASRNFDPAFFGRVLLAFIFVILAGDCSAQTNSWIQAGDGFWDDPINWSLGLAPSIAQSLVVIENAGSKTATIDRYTVAFYPSTLVVSNLAVNGSLNSTNTLLLDNAGPDHPLQILTDLMIGSNGLVRIVNSGLSWGASGGTIHIDGTLAEDSGNISVQTADVRIGTAWPGNFFLKDGVFRANSLTVGFQANGMMNQSAGSNTLDTLLVGDSNGAAGTYTLGTGDLLASVGIVGNAGSGTFNQFGGTATFLEPLILGRTNLGIGAYNFSAGFLHSGELDVGLVGTGTFVQFGGLNDVEDVVALGGDDDTIGTDQVRATVVQPATDGRPQGTYNLLAGRLQSDNLYIGLSGVGTFTQSGGVDSIGSTLLMGTSGIGEGFYFLSAGTLLVSNAVIGSHGLGTFTQTGGLHRVTSDIMLGDTGHGRYNLARGSLSAGSITLGGGEGVNSSGIFEQSGGTNTVSILTIGKFTGSSIYSLAGGNLNGTVIIIGSQGTGVFNQTGGTNAVKTSLSLGQSSGGSGTYNLTNGILSSPTLSLGASFLGLFNQYGGRSSNGTVFIGVSPGSSGSYNLSDGVALSGQTFVGQGGSGSIIQSGGTNIVGKNLYLGFNASGVGSYSLISGRLEAASTVIGVSGRGNIVVNGGQMFVSSNLSVGASSSLDLVAGSVTAASMQIDGGGQLVLEGSGARVDGGTITNNGTIRGLGIISNAILNSGAIYLTNSSFNLFGPITNNPGGQIEIAGSSISMPGNIVNLGTVSNHDAMAIFSGSYNENGRYFSRQATSVFQDWNVGTAGYVQTMAASQFIVGGDFHISSTQSALWNSTTANIQFTGGSGHVMQLPGVDRGAGSAGYSDNFMWNQLELGPGQSLSLIAGNAGSSSALYVGVLALDDGTNQIASITGNGLTIYYDANAPANAYLGNRTYALNSGGLVTPVNTLPRLSVAARGLAGFDLQFNFISGRNYLIQFSNDLQTWTNVTNPVLSSPSPGVYSWTDDGSLTGGLATKRFYRVVVQ